VKPGRPRAFDLDAAIDKAMLIFWERGYEGTTLNDLTAAFGIQRGSFYKAFGSKEALFERVLLRYQETVASYTMDALDQPTALEVIASMWRNAADASTGRDTPNGCLIVQAALGTSADSSSAHEELTRIRNEHRSRLVSRFDRSVDEGDLPPETNTGALADYVVAVQWGISVRARTGGTRDEVQAMVDFALANLGDNASTLKSP